MSRIFHFSLPGIVCVNCVSPVETALTHSKIPIESFAIDVIEKCASITVKETDKTDQEISDVLQSEIGEMVECVPFEQADTRTPQAPNEITRIDQGNIKKIQRKTFRQHLIKGLVGSLLGVGLMAIMMTGIEIPMLVMYALSLACSALTLYLGKESYQEAWKKLTKSKMLTMDTLFTVSTATVIVVSIASFFFPWLPMMMEAGLMIFGFRHLGKAIEESIKQKMVAELSFKAKGAKTIIKKIQTVNNVQWTSCAAETIKKDDIVRIKRGETIPFDGICQADASIYDTILKGSTLPRFIHRGEQILAGMRVDDDVPYIEMQVTQAAANSYLARQDEQLLQANAEKAAIELKTNHILQYFVPAVLAFSLAAGIVVGIFFNPAFAIQCATTLLVSACPCTLGFITPLAIKVGMTKAAEHGVQFKSGKALQSADQINTVLIDLHGTLTTGVPIVKNYQICSGKGTLPQSFFNYLWVIESESKKPIAKAICEYIHSKKMPIDTNYKMTIIDKSNHSGIKAKINGEWVYAGNKNFMQEQGIDVSSLDSKMQKGQNVYVAKEKELLGMVSLKDPLRTDAAYHLNELRKNVNDVRICTGGDIETAKYYAKKLNIPENKIYANCVGASDGSNHHSKVDIIDQLQREGKRVAMVGDGTNDTLAIAKCDFGVAVKSLSGDEITQQEAGAVVNNNSLAPLVTAFSVAKETVSSIKQNLLISLSYNSVMMITACAAIAIGFALNPGIGVALMTLQTSLILLNMYRIKRQALNQTDTKSLEPDHCIFSSSYHQFNRSGIRFIKSKTVCPNTKVSNDIKTTTKKDQLNDARQDYSASHLTLKL